MAPWRHTMLVAFTIAASTLTLPTAGVSAGAAAFPCRWTYSLHVGLRVGYDTGGENADCTGIPGTLTLSARLYRATPASHSWRLVRSASQSWSNPTGNRYIELNERCTRGKVRAVFTWALHGRDGHLLARNTVSTAPVNDPGGGCKYLIG